MNALPYIDTTSSEFLLSYWLLHCSCHYGGWYNSVTHL